MERLVALVGRPNVGKSTLFNRIVGGRPAAVAALPGLTRDRRYGEALWEGRPFRVVDTGGLEPTEEDALKRALLEQTRVAIGEADVVVCVLDGREGPTLGDREVVALLRSAGKPVVWAVNKIDAPARDDLVLDFYELGLEPLITLSAEHARGIDELLDAVFERLPEDTSDEDEAPVDAPIRVALVGRPNVGKSSLFNRLVGLDRAVVHDMPGTTVDPVDTLLTVGERRYQLVDTAGIRRHRRAAGPAEGLGVALAFRAIERCQVALVLLDAREGVTTGDVRVAGLAEERGVAVALLLNKWDLLSEEERAGGARERELRDRLGLLEHAPLMSLSARTGLRAHKVLELVDRIHAEGSKKVPTAELNRVVAEAVARHAPPMDGTRSVRIYYGTQTGTLPPRFTFFTNRPGSIGEGYRRYLVKRLREAFGFEGSPVWIRFRGRDGRRAP